MPTQSIRGSRRANNRRLPARANRKSRRSAAAVTDQAESSFTSDPLTYDFFRVAPVAVNLVVEPAHFIGRDRVCQFRQHLAQGGHTSARVLPHQVNRLVRRKVMSIVGELKQIQRGDAADRKSVV